MNPKYDSPFATCAGVLAGWSTARAEGPDAAAFLQSQLSSDVNALPVGHAQWSAWLNPKGRLIALILLRRRTEHSFDLLLPDLPAGTLAPALSRFILRRKLSLTERVDTQIHAGIDSPPPADAVKLADAARRWLTVVTATDGPGAAGAIDAAWLALDLLTGVPRVDAASDGHTAHMLGLQRLQAISLAKGCYPGQEIVARTHYLGQSKRSLCCVRLPAGPQPIRGSAITREGQPLGEVVATAVAADGSLLVQAVASSLQPGQTCDCDGREGQVLELASPPLPMG